MRVGNVQMFRSQPALFRPLSHTSIPRHIRLAKQIPLIPQFGFGSYGGKFLPVKQLAQSRLHGRVIFIIGQPADAMRYMQPTAPLKCVLMLDKINRILLKGRHQYVFVLRASPAAR